MIAEAIVAYMVVCADVGSAGSSKRSESLNYKVSILLDEGFEPFGSISNDRWSLCQAMVKRGKS